MAGQPGGAPAVAIFGFAFARRLGSGLGFSFGLGFGFGFDAKYESPCPASTPDCVRLLVSSCVGEVLAADPAEELPSP